MTTDGGSVLSSGSWCRISRAAPPPSEENVSSASAIFSTSAWRNHSEVVTGLPLQKTASPPATGCRKISLSAIPR